MPVPSDWTLEGKVAIITDDPRGWTPVLAGALAEAGADVAVAGASQPQVAAAAAPVRDRGRAALELVGEFADADATEAAVASVVERLGGLDILVNAANTEFGKPALDVTDGEMAAVMERNVAGAFRWCQAAGRHMVKQGAGHIVSLISAMAERGLSNHAPYSATQAAVQQLTRSLSLEWGPSGVRVNCIATGWFEVDPPPIEEQQQELLVRYLPLRRKGTPEEIAALLVYLSADLSDFTTGQTIFVDGGAMAHA